MLKIDACNIEDNLFDDASIIVDCILNNKYHIKTMINLDCIEYVFIDINVAHEVCKFLNIEFLKLNKSRELKEFDERRNKDVIHAVYSSMIIENHTKSSTSFMIIKLDQHSIILNKS